MSPQLLWRYSAVLKWVAVLLLGIDAGRDFSIYPMTPSRVLDRLRLCWGHLDDWTNLKIVKQSREWLQEVNATYTPTTSIAYLSGTPVGMIESIPYELVAAHGLCPCRVPSEDGKMPIQVEGFGRDLFISCLYVAKENQRKGIGRALVSSLLRSEHFRHFEGALVYACRRQKEWEQHIHWPAGPAEFYLRAGFVPVITAESSGESLLRYVR
jgi:GNAT superfamily N-acetyltransferase